MALKPAEADIELRVGAAVERAGGDDVVARLHQAADGQELGGLSAGGGQRADTALQRRHALFEHGGGGVHDARVDVAEALQREELGGVRAVFKNERRRLVDGHGARAGGRIGLLAGMQGTGAETHRAVGGGFGHKLQFSGLSALAVDPAKRQRDGLLGFGAAWVSSTSIQWHRLYY
jgi:hypothetical protein